MQDAARADAELQAGTDRGPLHGIPYALKDIYDTAGIRTTCHSRLRLDNVPAEDSVVAARLAEAGGVLLGKLATHEFAIGGPSFDLPFPPARNPWNPDHITGGSSSGSGTAVAAGMVRLAMGSDTAGSIRGPASWCGTVGIKPTYGRVSRRGVFPAVVDPRSLRPADPQRRGRGHRDADPGRVRPGRPCQRRRAGARLHGRAGARRRRPAHRHPARLLRDLARRHRAGARRHRPHRRANCATPARSCRTSHCPTTRCSPSSPASSCCPRPSPSTRPTCATGSTITAPSPSGASCWVRRSLRPTTSRRCASAAS